MGKVTNMRRVALFSAGVVLWGVACGSSSEPAAEGSPELASSTVAPATAVPTTGAPATSTPATGNDATAFGIDTSCFTLDDDFEFPEGRAEYVGFSTGPTTDTCEFLIQLDQLADTSVIIGTTLRDPDPLSHDEAVEIFEGLLERGAELQHPMLRLLNSGPTGEPLEVVDRETRTEPVSATVLWHESGRRAGLPAVTAIVELPPEPDGASNTLVIWGLMAYEENVELINRLLDHLVVTDPRVAVGDSP